MWTTFRRSQVIGETTGLDIAVLCSAYYLAFLIRFEGALPAEESKVLWGTLPALVVLQFLLLAALNVHRLTWRYVGLMEARRIGVALALASGLLMAWRLGSVALGVGVTGAPLAKIP